ncbi:MAG: DMT family transporter [Clostridiaceae bacterium]|jgi:drug/metabolite transporter (DMT)-like permease|nr:DMT family transporter [Bacillota bacterium]NLI38274.1 DMT family transporter [Clostridiaceae bacterium]
MKNRFLGLLLMFLAIFVWGISFVSTKIVLTELPPVSIAFFRQFVAIVPLLAFMLIRQESFKPDKGDLKLFALASFFGIVLYFVFENTGLTMTTASNASMLAAAIPVFVLIAESVMARRPISKPSLGCILASLLGVYCIISENGAIDLSGSTFLGNLLILGAMASWIVYTFISKGLGERYSSLKLTTVQTLLSIPLFIPFTVSEVPAWQVPSQTAFLHLLFLGVFCSALAYVFFLYSINTLGPVLPSASLNLIPVITIITGRIVLAEELTWLQAAGAVLIVGGLTLLSLMKLREQAQQRNGKEQSLK